MRRRAKHGHVDHSLAVHMLLVEGSEGSSIMTAADSPSWQSKRHIMTCMLVRHVCMPHPSRALEKLQWFMS